jgi:hypothetical protein
MRSTIADEGERVRAVPVVGVRAMLTMVTLNERMEGEAYRGVAPDGAVGGALVLDAAARGQGEGGEQEYEKKGKSFAPIHVAPHDRFVCVCPSWKGERSQPPLPNVTRRESGKGTQKTARVFNC